MLLKSLKIHNFRQFIDENISFGADPDKNVTIIMGDNGSGKTTIAQAFSWCLYCSTDFKDNILLNRKIANEMPIDGEETVSAELLLRHGEVDYTITTSQVYRKEFTGKVKAFNPSQSIRYKRSDGQQEFIKDSLKVQGLIRKILPKDLSRYFFFDGERINLMSKEIQNGHSTTFMTAVRGLLGLGAFEAAIGHLKPTSRTSVIGKYTASFNSNTNTTIGNLSEKISDYTDRINNTRKKIDSLAREKEQADQRIVDLVVEIKSHEEGEKLQQRKDSLSNKRDTAQASLVKAKEKLFKDFGAHANGYFIQPLIRDALEMIAQQDLEGKDIPAMHAKTIDFLLKRGECICGEPLVAGDSHYQHLVDLLQYLPPQSIGVSANNFSAEANSKKAQAVDAYVETVNTAALIESIDESIVSYEGDIAEIEKQLEGYTGVGHLQQELSLCQKTSRDNSQKIQNYNEEVGRLEWQKGQWDAQLQSLALADNQNKKIATYKAYAQYIFDTLSREYSIEEEKTRTELQESINQIFKTIYAGGLSLKIDDRYNIQVFVDQFSEFNNDIETSTAQSISVIFAFISGIIKMARERQTAGEDHLVETEAYPLVMDAPLSAFDKRRIKTVCETLPNVAEQVIIFIKDTDGDIANEHMQGKIGAQYTFEKVNEFETHLK